MRHSLLTLAAIPALLLTTVPVADAQPNKWSEIKEPGKFVVSLCRDLSGNVWIGTEDKGVWRLDAKSDQLTQFTTKDGLGDDNAYALACDKQGRVWAGLLNHGVAVFNGEKWRTYDVLDGPLGECVFAIAVCPTDGDVWMATSAGLTRYSIKTDSWSHFTRAEGLAADQANAIAFDAAGTIYVGTQCDGIAIARGPDYKAWAVKAGPEKLPTEPRGNGLPTSLINALLVGRDGMIYAATTAGLARSRDRGLTWTFVRGRDYTDKVRGLFGGAPKGWKEAPKAITDQLLPADYITCLAEDDAGLIWMGFRQHGYVALDPKSDRVVFSGDKKTERLPDDYVFAIQPAPDFKPLVGTYGGGVGQANEAMKNNRDRIIAAESPIAAPAIVPLPSPATKATPEQLASWIKEFSKMPSVASPYASRAVALADDWKTRGDFYGTDPLRDYRYGELHASLCAFCSPFDAAWGRRGAMCDARLGENRTKDDSLRNWVHWPKTDDVRSLKNPYEGRRRQSEWDDHKEAYRLGHDGPHMYVDITVPAGTYILSFYFFNKDGHDGMNRVRDYLLTVKRGGRTDAEFAAAPVLARSRVRNFWGGVYKAFAVPGGGQYTIKIDANYSFNTIVSGVFLDPLVITPEWRKSNPDVKRLRHSFTPDELERLHPAATKAACDAASVFAEWQRLRTRSPFAFIQRSRQAALAVLSTVSEGQPDQVRQRISAECMNQLRLFDRRDAAYAELDAKP